MTETVQPDSSPLTGHRKPNPGQFKKGQSGNPGGTKKLPEGFKEECRKASPEALKNLIRWQGSTSEPAASVAASKTILAYAYGQPPQFMTLEGMATAKVIVTIGGKVVADRPASISPEAV